MRDLFIWLLLVLGITSGSQAFAQTVVSSDDTLVTELNTVQINDSVQRANSILKTSSVISAADIERYNTRDMVLAINQTPGINIQSGALNTNRIVIRGIGARTPYGTNKLKTYLDGIPITNGNGETDIDGYNPSIFSGLEVVKGPKSPVYGSSLGGTILLNSKTPSREGIRLANRTTLGSFGLLKNSLMGSVKKGKWYLLANYDHLESNGYRENSSYNRNSIFLKTGYTFSDKTRISALFNYHNYRAFIPSSVGETDFTYNPEVAAANWKAARGYEDDEQVLAGISIQQKLGAFLENETSVFVSFNNHYEPRPFNILNSNTEGFGARSVFLLPFNLFNKSGKLQVGGEFYRDNYEWKTIENLYQSFPGEESIEGELLSQNEELRTRWNGFIQGNFQVIQNLDVEVGLNINQARFEYRDELDTEFDNLNRKFEAFLSPSLQLSYSPKPSKLFYISAGRGLNYPTLEETLTPEGMVNPEIGPEWGWNYEAGTDLSFFDEKLHLNFNAYLMEVENLLVAERVGEDQYIGRNAGETEHMGIEFQSSYSFKIDSKMMVKPFLSFEFNHYRFREFNENGVSFNGNKLTGVPNQKWSGGIDLQIDKLYFTINGLYMGEIPMNDQNSLYSSPYFLLNSQAKYRFAFSQKLVFEVFAGINNILNEDYASSILINATGFGNSEPRYYYPGEPINYFGGVALKWN